VNLGIALRRTDVNNLYKAYIDGNRLYILRIVNGQPTVLSQKPVPTSEGVPQQLRFRAFGTTLFAKVWRQGTTEPQDWMITANDNTFSTGQFGIRVVEQASTTISVTFFSAKAAYAENNS
jgi:hypothetical protein